MSRPVFHSGFADEINCTLTIKLPADTQKKVSALS